MPPEGSGYLASIGNVRCFRSEAPGRRRSWDRKAATLNSVDDREPIDPPESGKAKPQDRHQGEDRDHASSGENTRP